MQPAPSSTPADLDRLGDEIAMLSAHLDAATARLLALGYRVERDADGTLAFRTPGGRPIPAVPAPPAVPPDASRALVAAHRARGLAIDARTGCPSWDGERLDLG